MKSVHPYINFPGNTREALEFYQSVFGKNMGSIMYYKDAPESLNVEEHDKNKVMHTSLPIGNNITLMASDLTEAEQKSYKPATNFYLYIEAENKEEADTLFNKLKENGNVEMPMGDTFWGSYFGMCQDKYQVKWMVGYEYPQ